MESEKEKEKEEGRKGQRMFIINFFFLKFNRFSRLLDKQWEAI